MAVSSPPDGVPIPWDAVWNLVDANTLTTRSSVPFDFTLGTRINALVHASETNPGPLRRRWLRLQKRLSERRIPDGRTAQ